MKWNEITTYASCINRVSSFYFGKKGLVTINRRRFINLTYTEVHWLHVKMRKWDWWEKWVLFTWKKMVAWRIWFIDMSSKKLPFVRVHQREKDKDCNNGGLSGCGTMQQLLKNYLSFHFKRTYVCTYNTMCADCHDSRSRRSSHSSLKMTKFSLIWIF